MSDSDDDALPNDVYTFQNDNTTISARGPNVNSSNITGLSFRNNVLTSTMHMPVNFDRPRYGSSNSDHRSMYYRRETSPMSLRSVSDYKQTAFSRSSYQNGLGSQRSMYNGRGGSPMSVRSIDSTVSVSDIVFAFKNVKFNKYDLRIIKDAYNKLIKTRQRKRIEKRRNLKLFLKGTRRKSGEDSGEQGSDSSVSSDDCRSVRTTICKENLPGLREMKDISHFSTRRRGDTNCRTDISHFSSNMKMNQMFKDCTENIKQNSLRNMMAFSSSVSNVNTKQPFLNTIPSQNLNEHAVKNQNASVMTQKERFQKGFLLPSQRFNNTIIGQTQVNNAGQKTKSNEKIRVDPLKPTEQTESSSGEEDIFRGFSVSEKSSNNDQRKRLLEIDEISYSNKKRNNLQSPKKLQNSAPSELKSHRTTKHCENDIINEESHDFVFAKPKMLVKKNNTKKRSIPEKLLAKSRVPPIEEEIDFHFSESNIKHIENEGVNHIEDTQSDMLHSNSDVSMRPSFIKRKLFTQKLDVAENKNASCDNLGINSPQNIYSASMRERNKARKLVTSQSCLSRDVQGEDNNVLDLIHKIVPPDKINSTNVANKTESYNNKSNDVDNANKWDVTAIIANCDNQDISDTYTDEEIFNINVKNSEKRKPSPKKVQECKIVVKKLPPKKLNTVAKDNESLNKITEKNKRSVTDCVKSFWDTDIESDMDFNVAPSWKKTIQQNQETVLRKANHEFEDKHNGSKTRGNKKAPISKGTILTVRSSHQSKPNNNIKYHTNSNSSDKVDIEFNKPKTFVQEKENTKVDKNNKPNLTSQTGKIKDTINENVSVNNKKEGGRKPKARECVDCNIKANSKITNMGRHEVISDNKKNDIKSTLNNGNIPVRATLKSKDCKNSEAMANKDTNKLTKSSHKNAKTQREPVNNGRIQPKRKSKDKSFIQSSTQKVTKLNQAPNKMPKTKSKELTSNNTSINSISTIMTRSREKLLFNSSQSDYSSMNLSNVSNRSLRLRQRVQRNIN